MIFDGLSPTLSFGVGLGTKIMGHRYLNIFLFSAILLMGRGLPLSAQSTAPTPTFSKDIAPIIYQHCASCHRAGEIAPMSLLSYDEVRPWAAAIRTKVATGAMPPWHSAAPRGQFSNDRRLSDAEKDLIMRWVAGGAPKGDVKDQPPLPVFEDKWEIGKPDAIITMPEPYVVPASGVLAYQNIMVPTNFTEDKWVQAIEVRPGTRSVVHHILVFCLEQGEPRPMAYKMVVPQLPERARQREARGPSLLASVAPG